MPSEIVSISGLLLMLVLGLRHGLDPDHIILRLSQLSGSMSVHV